MENFKQTFVTELIDLRYFILSIFSEDGRAHSLILQLPLNQEKKRRGNNITSLSKGELCMCMCELKYKLKWMKSCCCFVFVLFMFDFCKLLHLCSITILIGTETILLTMQRIDTIINENKKREREREREGDTVMTKNLCYNTKPCKLILLTNISSSTCSYLYYIHGTHK